METSREGFSLVAQIVKNMPAMWRSWFNQSHSSIFAWRIPWPGETDGLSVCGHEELDTTEWLSFLRDVLQLDCICWVSAGFFGEEKMKTCHFWSSLIVSIFVCVALHVAKNKWWESFVNDSKKKKKPTDENQESVFLSRGCGLNCAVSYIYIYIYIYKS